MTKDDRPPLTAEEFDEMMEDIRSARRELAVMMSRPGHDPEKAAGMMAEIVSAMKWAIDRRFSGMSEAEVRTEADGDLASKVSVLEL